MRVRTMIDNRSGHGKFPLGSNHEGSPAPPPQVFISYSRTDRDLVKRLLAHLEVLESYGLIRIFCDLDIEGGQRWCQEIERAIDESSLALVMVSPHLLSSSFVNEHELPRMLGREGKLQVVPILLLPCPWEACPWLEELQIHMPNGRALGVGTMEEIETGFAALALKVLSWLQEGPQDDPPAAGTAEKSPGAADASKAPAPEGKLLEARERFRKRPLAFWLTCWLAEAELRARVRSFADQPAVPDAPRLYLPFATGERDAGVDRTAGLAAAHILEAAMVKAFAGLAAACAVTDGANNANGVTIATNAVAMAFCRFYPLNARDLQRHRVPYYWASFFLQGEWQWPEARQHFDQPAGHVSLWNVTDMALKPAILQSDTAAPGTSTSARDLRLLLCAINSDADNGLMPI